MNLGGRILAFAVIWCVLAIGPAIAQPGDAPKHSELIPPEKNLSAEKIERLYSRGEPLVYSGEDLNTIGMPVGGLAAGQLYLRGDGTLAKWWIFNGQHHTWADPGYTTFRPNSPVEQGFAVVTEVNGELTARTLCREDFPRVTFRGEYPIATVNYPARDFPVEVTMEAFSPFIPLNAEDSALPATMFHITLRNTTSEPVRTGLVGWLQNAVCCRPAKPGGPRGFREGDRAAENLVPDPRMIEARRQTDITDLDRGTCLSHSIRPAPGIEPEARRVVFEDFEGEDYGEWEVTGKAFGDGPAGGTLGTQQKVSGVRGDRLVNTFLGGDDPHGTLTSPRFEITRRFVSFLIGGGRHPVRTCMNLLVDGEVVRTATGGNSERLEWHFWDVSDFMGEQARLQIVDRHSGGWGHVNVDHIEFADVPRTGSQKPLEERPEYGSLALALAGSPAKDRTAQRLADAVEADGPTLHSADEMTYPAHENRNAALAAGRVTLAPGEDTTRTFVLTWYFPNHPRGRHYAQRFASARDVASYVLRGHDRLTADTRLWRETFYRDSTLPWWLLFRLHAPVANLASETCQWWSNGRFWAWEGVGCCAGTCTHVWNYQDALARLFPSLARNIRDRQDFGEGFDPESGLVGFRSNRAYAADGQCGTVLKAYREHLMSADSEFLEDHWPRIKMAMQFSIDRDGDGNGLLEGSQHNTFDVNFFGPNTFVGSLYLASLRAAEEMAREVGDEEFAERCHRIFERGSEETVEKLWNGEYFIQKVDLEKHPRHQYGEGCLCDQVFGQNWAHQLGLGYIYPVEKIKGALESVWKYNWAPDIGPYSKKHPPYPRRKILARPGEPGLFVCTFPKSAYLSDGMRHKNQVWTGCEYQVASHMVWEGMLDKALVICSGVHERYHPSRHNPYNEVECGEHYARALASWGVLIALAGFDYDGPDSYMAFAPRIQQDDFKAAFTAAQGWGMFSQERSDGRQRNRIEVRWGRLRLRTLELAVPENTDPSEVTLRVSGERLTPRCNVENDTLRVELQGPVTLHRGQALEVSVR